MKNYFEKQFELRYFEMNKFQEASPTTMLTLLEETAADHCHAIGNSLFDLLNRNIGWVLVSGTMQIDRYPKYKENIKIRTWLSEFTTIKGIRENIIYDEKNHIIGRSKGMWLYFDIQKRRPVPIDKVFIDKWGIDKEQSMEYNLKQKISPIEISENHLEYKVNNFDIDSNQHVNNIRYLQWAMDTMPQHFLDMYTLSGIDGSFLSEAKYGDIIISDTLAGEKENSFKHTIRTAKDEKVCVVAQTYWKLR